jgi:Leucine-rich repeat (LRR) protein
VQGLTQVTSLRLCTIRVYPGLVELDEAGEEAEEADDIPFPLAEWDAALRPLTQVSARQGGSSAGHSSCCHAPAASPSAAAPIPPQLRSLDVGFNQLETLPPSVLAMRGLTHLGVS